MLRICIIAYYLLHAYLSKNAALRTTNIATNHATVEAAVDSTASDTYFPAWYQGYDHNNTPNDTCVGTANNSIMGSVATNTIHLDGIPEAARTCKKFVEVTLPIISVVKLCIHGMIVVFDIKHVQILDRKGTTVATGKQDPQRNIYLIKVPIVSSTPMATVLATIEEARSAVAPRVKTNTPLCNEKNRITTDVYMLNNTYNPAKNSMVESDERLNICTSTDTNCREGPSQSMNQSEPLFISKTTLPHNCGKTVAGHKIGNIASANKCHQSPPTSSRSINLTDVPSQNNAP